jgi:RNA polymerase sigma-70 factor (sigma-E family)
MRTTTVRRGNVSVLPGINEGVMGEARAQRAGLTADESGFDTLYRDHRDRLRRTAYLMTGQAAIAEEIVHDAFIRVHNRWSSIDTPGAYLRRTVVNLCLAWRQRDTMARERLPRPPAPVELPEIDETWALLTRLSPEQRVAVVLRFYEDLPTDEIAQIMGCRTATVRTRIHRAINVLRKEMTP